MTGLFRDAELSGCIGRTESYDKLFAPISN
jgi:hypothetical protein